MSEQRLVLPLNDLRVTAGYKNADYLKNMSMVHYGMDCTSLSRTVYACGDGEVIAAGMDGAALTGASSRLGNVAVVVYRDVLCNDGKKRDLACRMLHFAELRVKAGQKITKDTIVGIYGNTGAYSVGPHLHIEFDTDIEFPTLAYGVSVGGRIINTAAEYKRAGGVADSTIGASRIWFVDGNQEIKLAAANWASAADAAAPKLPSSPPIPPVVDWQSRAEVAEKERDALKKSNAELEDKIVAAKKALG